MDEVGLGRRLQEARKKAGLTQQELCQKANLSYSTLAKIERGAIKAPSIFTIQSIAAALGTDLNGLIGFLAPAGQNPPETPRKRSKSGIRFTYFDVNGCLVRFFNRAFTKLSHDTGATIDRIETAYWHFNDAANRGEMSMRDFNEAMARQVGLSSLDWQEYYLEAVEPISEMDELLNWVNDQYYFGLLSNSMPGLITAMIERGILPRLPYSAIIDSSEVHTLKPEAKIFEIAQAKAGVEPGEILFVDDSRPNLMAAEKMGWHVLWFDDYRPEESVIRIRQSLEPE